MQTRFEYKIGGKVYKAAFNGKFLEVASEKMKGDFFENWGALTQSGFKALWQPFYFGVIASDRLAEQPDSLTEIEAENLFYDHPKIFKGIMADLTKAISYWQGELADEPQEKKSRSNSGKSKK